MQRGERYNCMRTRKPQRFSRIVRMHANDREEVDFAIAGDIVAVLGLDCVSGDTFCGDEINLALEGMFVAEPVISLAVGPKKTQDRDRFSKALNRFSKEDPTFHVGADPETGETVISGMGELHLDIYVERIRREYKVELDVGRPRVSYREAPRARSNTTTSTRSRPAAPGNMPTSSEARPLPENHEEGFEFENEVFGGRIPTEYIPSVEKGFRSMLTKGPLAGYQITGVKMVLEDGSSHAVDSSDMAFQICARDCFRQTFLGSKPSCSSRS